MFVLRKLNVITLDHASSPSGSVPVKSLSSMKVPRRLSHWAIEFGRVPVNELLSTFEVVHRETRVSNSRKWSRSYQHTSHLEVLQLAPIADIFRKRSRKNIVRYGKLEKVPVYDWCWQCSSEAVCIQQKRFYFWPSAKSLREGARQLIALDIEPVKVGPRSQRRWQWSSKGIALNLKVGHFTPTFTNGFREWSAVVWTEKIYINQKAMVWKGEVYEPRCRGWSARWGQVRNIP